MVTVFGNPIESSLTFEWFLENVVCKEKPRLCEQNEEDANSDRKEEMKLEILDIDK